MQRTFPDGDGTASELTVTPLKERYWAEGHDSHHMDEEDLLFTSETAKGFMGLSPNSHARYSPTKAPTASGGAALEPGKGLRDGELEAQVKQLAVKGAAAMQIDDPEFQRGNSGRRPPESSVGAARAMARKISAGHATTDAARLVALEEECRALNQQLHSQEKGLIQLTAEGEKAKKTIAALQQRVEKEQAATADLGGKLRLAESQLALAKKEVAVLQRQATKATVAAAVGAGAGGSANTNSKDASRQLSHAGGLKEENERLRAEVDRLRAAATGAGAGGGGGAAVSGSSAQAQHLVTENKKLEAQRMELLACVRKQNKLIDILKRQKMHLEASRLLEISEEELAKAMEHPLPGGPLGVR